MSVLEQKHEDYDPLVALVYALKAPESRRQYPQRTMNELRIEIFRPPYLFRGKRPVIDKCPNQLQYGKSFEIESSGIEKIRDVCLIRPSITTHCVNTEQRYIGLEFSKSGTTTLQTSIPPNRNLAPPGYYMLFILSEDRIPSVAKFIHLS